MAAVEQVLPVVVELELLVELEQEAVEEEGQVGTLELNLHC